MRRKIFGLTILIATLLMVSMLAVQTEAASSSLVGYWKFDESVGTTTIDSSGNGNTGTLNNGPTWGGGKYGEALSFDGIDDYVRVEDSSSLHFSTSVTLIVWIFLPSSVTYAGDDYIIGKQASNGGTNLDLGIHDNLGHVTFGLGIGGGFTGHDLISTGAVPRDTWTHIAATYDGSLMKLYINGVFDSSFSWASGFSSNTNPLTIGSKNPPYVESFIKATIDEVKIFNTALTQQEVQAEMLGLVGYWKFDESSGTTAIDSSGNGNTGTLNNGPTWVDGKYGKALSFDGVDDFVLIHDSPSLHLSSAVTVESWVYLPIGADYSQYAKIVSKAASNGGTNLDFGIWDNSGHVDLGIGTGGGSGAPIMISTQGVPRDVWTHIAGTYDGANMKIYINSVFDSSYPWAGGINTDNGRPLTIGKSNFYPSANEFWFNGKIDDVRVYDRALSQQEIQADMTGLRTATLNLTPTSGFAATTLVGSGFAPNSRMSVTWDGTQLPTVPNPLITDANGNFTAIISVPTQNTPGAHTVKATDASGSEASATFTVTDMTGLQGIQGLQGTQGPKGDTGSAGPPGETREVSIIIVASTTAASILAICLATIALLKKRT